LGSKLSGPSTLLKTLGANYTTGFLAFHYFTDALGAQTICIFRDSGTIQVDLRIDASGGLFFTRNGTTLGSVSTSKLSANTWYWIVVKVTIDNSAGVAECKVDGTSYLALSSQDTQQTGNAFFNQIALTSGGGLSPDFDNVVFWDTVSGSGNDLTGYPSNMTIVDTAWVTGAGNNAQWTPSAGSNYQNVDETNSNDDTDYNSSNTTNQIDDFAVGSLHASTATVIGVGVNTIDRVDDATLHTVSHHVESASATADGTAFTVSGSYVNHQTLFTLDPNTSAAWTVSGRNAAKFGYKLVS